MTNLYQIASMSNNISSLLPEAEKIYYVYVLRCANGKTYTGCTGDILDRLTRHNRGSVPATKDIRPVQLLSCVVFRDKYKAFEFEKYLKTGSGRAFMNKRLV